MVKVLDTILSQSAYSAEIDVPFEKVDIADWLFTLPEAEYLRCCPPDHIAAGVTWTDDGRRMSINVEQIARASSCSTMWPRSPSLPTAA